MGIKTCLAGLCLAVLAATVIDVSPVEAQTYTAQPDRLVNRPRARITVEPRSFLDAGTEVLPGERKFTDYAFPTGSYSPLILHPYARARARARVEARNAKHGRARGLAPVAAAGAIRSSEPL